MVQEYEREVAEFANKDGGACSLPVLGWKEVEGRKLGIVRLGGGIEPEGIPFFAEYVEHLVGGWFLVGYGPEMGEFLG